MFQRRLPTTSNVRKPLQCLICHAPPLIKLSEPRDPIAIRSIQLAAKIGKRKNRGGNEIDTLSGDKHWKQCEGGCKVAQNRTLSALHDQPASQLLVTKLLEGYGKRVECGSQGLRTIVMVEALVVACHVSMVAISKCESERKRRKTDIGFCRGRN